MYQLLIVDDEHSVVDSLAFTIPWSDYGIETVYPAYSAEEALHIAANHTIDIMITDIRMPEMDGLELIYQLRRLSKKIRCIILSGHDEFEYAQRAISYGTESYLLKPVDIGQLIKSVQAIVSSIEQEWIELSSHQRLKHAMHTNLPLLQDRLLNELIQQKPISEDALQERLSLLNLSFQMGDPFVMMLVRLDEQFAEYDFDSLSLLEYAVTNIAQEVFQDLFELWHCTTDAGYLVFLIRSREQEALTLIDSSAVKLQNHVQRFLKGSLTICISGTKSFPDHIQGTYHKSVISIQRNAGGHKSYFLRTDEAAIEPEEYKLPPLYDLPLLPNLLESGKWDKALGILNRALGMNTEYEPTHDQLLAIVLLVSSSLAMTFSMQNGSLEEQLGEEFNLLLRKKSHLSRQRVWEWAEKIVIGLRDQSATQLEDSHQRIASKVQSFIDEHLAEGISLQTVADYIGLHPVYLSKVYKTVTGETIGDYLYTVRMERAAYLLKHSDLKIGDVSSQIGFLAAPHFIKIFKKHYGATPQEYRNKT
ncbi:response regulator [Paenibacillus luteus]|uniref:response regulator n=1 Tax=Paenibacillus luteus TaxID=2545753 RepID=UPI001144039A|nr:response regulator [Paenibacillus luteus]